jgi:hypothetical protein
MIIQTDLYDGIETVEFKITNTTVLKYQFPDIPKLRGKIIRRIDFNGSPSINKSPEGNQVVDYSILKNVFVTFVSKRKEIIKNYPAYDLFQSYGSDLRSDFFNESFDLPDCYFIITTSSGLVLNQSFLVSLYWQEPKKEQFSYSIPKTKIDYCEAIVTSVTDTVFKIDNFKNLRGKKIWRIVTFFTGASTYYTPDSRIIIGSTQQSSSYITLWDKKEEIIKDLPIPKIYNDNTAQNHIFFRGVIIDWDKSYIKIGNTSGLVAGTVYYLPIFYTD